MFSFGAEGRGVEFDSVYVMVVIPDFMPVYSCALVSP